MSKTIIGKNGYLFLRNDSCEELKVHCNNLLLLKDDFYQKYEKYFNKLLIVVFPDKSYVCKEHLPDSYIAQYRPAFNLYNKYFKNHIIDGYEHLQNINDTYYKTDTHINFKGSYIIYKAFVRKINELFQLNIFEDNIEIIKKDCTDLSIAVLGFGDLVNSRNLGEQILSCNNDTYYYSPEINDIYMKLKINVDNNIKLYIFENNILYDKTIEENENILNWYIVSKYIIYNKNNDCLNDKKVLIFYDSFLLSTLQLYINMFSEVYLYKSIFRTDLCEHINPDLIFEFRVERFLL